MFKPYLKKSLREKDSLIVFLISTISSYCYDLMQTQSPESMNAASLGVPNTWPPNLHI
jgi:hypothetical protein